MSNDWVTGITAKMEEEMTVRTKLAVPLALWLILSACATDTSAQVNLDEPMDSSAQANPAEPLDGGSKESEGVVLQLSEGELPVQVQLVLGTLRLEDTALAVDSEQAAELVPLWKVFRSLTSSDTAAEAEIESVVNQIQSTMTSEQIAAITALGLTLDDIQALIEELGIADGFGGRDPNAAPGGGGFAPGGGGPGGGGGGPGGGFQGGAVNADPEAITTRQAERGSAGSRVGQFLIDPLIDVLEERASA
jgi:hypothetical protein